MVLEDVTNEVICRCDKIDGLGTFETCVTLQDAGDILACACCYRNTLTDRMRERVPATELSCNSLTDVVIASTRSVV